MNNPTNARRRLSQHFFRCCNLWLNFVAIIAMIGLSAGSVEAQLCGNQDFDSNYGCGTGVSVEVYGIGAHDQGNVVLVAPPLVQAANAAGNLDSVFVEVIAKGPVDTADFGPIWIITDNNDSCLVTPVVIEEEGSSMELAAAYRTIVDPTDVITMQVTQVEDSALMESVSAFAIMTNQQCVGGAAQIRGIFLFRACDTLVFPIGGNPTVTSRDIRIQIPVSELGDNPNAPDAPCIFEFNFYDNGGLIPQSYRDTINGQDNISDYLAIYDTTLVGVPGGLDSLVLEIISPGLPGIDSFFCEVGFGESFIIGSVIVDATCDPGDCCVITCAPPDTVFELCLFDIPDVPAALLDSVSMVNGMGQNIDSLSFVDTIMGEFTADLCDYFIILDSVTNELVDINGVQNVCRTRYFGIYRDSIGTFIYDTTCIQVICATSTGPIDLMCPSDTLLQCDISELPAYTTFDEFIAAGGSIGQVDFALDSMSFTLLSELSDGMSCPESITRTYYVADSCGNFGTCQQLITVNDTVPPMLICPPAITVQCTSEVAMTEYLTFDDFIGDGGSATDNCGLDSASFTLISVSDDSLSCPRTITRTYGVGDSCGNIGTCVQEVIINDTIPPVINSCPTDLVVNCIDEVPSPYTTWLALLTAPGFSLNPDNCGAIDTLNYSPFVSEMSDGNTCPETITRLYQVVDLCGNAATCQQVIIVNDTIPPTLTCPPDSTVQCPEDAPMPYASLDEFLAAGGAISDNCAVDSVTFTYLGETAIGTCPRTLLRFYGISDSCGNRSMSCEQTITVNDTIPPMINCPPDLMAQCDISEVPPYVNLDSFLMAGGMVDDNCGVDSMSFSLVSEVSDTMSCPETITRTYSIADSCGNSSTCQQLIVVNDTIPPMIVCPDDQTVQCFGDVQTPATDAFGFLLRGGLLLDNCAPVDNDSFLYLGDDTTGTCPAIITRRYSIADFCGNRDTCSQIITVNDTIPPMLMCPPDVDLGCNPPLPLSDDIILYADNFDGNIDNWQELTIGDPTGIEDPTCPEDWGGVFNQYWSFRAESPDRALTLYKSNANNSIGWRLELTNNTGQPLTELRMLFDFEVPWVRFDATENTRLAAFEVFVDQDGPGGMARQNIGASPVLSNAGVPAGEARRWYTDAEMDAFGLSARDIFIDATGLNIPDGQTYYLEFGTIGAGPAGVNGRNMNEGIDNLRLVAGDVFATDNCTDSLSTSVNDVTTINGCDGLIVRTYSAMDSCGNVASCTQRFTFKVDTIPPTFVAPIDTFIGCNPDTFIPPVVQYTDNCDPGGEVSVFACEVSINDGCLDTLVLDYVAVDSCGNENRQQVLVFFTTDTIPPD